MACNDKNIIFYRKSYVDLDKPNVNITITDPVAVNTGQQAVDFLRNRNNNSGWATTESNDSANTELLVEFGDIETVSDVMLVLHNFKNYLVEYHDDASDNFIEYVNVVDNEKTTNIHSKDIPIETAKIKITVYATQITNDDKSMRQLIITNKFLTGRLESFPQIKKPVHSKNRKVNKLLSGKVNVVETRGAFSCDLEVALLGSDSDLTIIEYIYENREGVLMLLSGAVEDQFRTKRMGYRDEDIVLVRPTNEYTNPYNQGIYTNGIKIKMSLAEAVF